jgi:hypothetical protein
VAASRYETTRSNDRYMLVQILFFKTQCFRYGILSLSLEIGTGCIDWAQLSRFYLKTETESSLQNIVFWKINRMVFLDKDRTMDNVQKHIFTNVPLSQTFRCDL